jgi:hypothetical protein
MDKTEKLAVGLEKGGAEEMSSKRDYDIGVSISSQTTALPVETFLYKGTISIDYLDSRASFEQRPVQQGLWNEAVDEVLGERKDLWTRLADL